MSRRRIILNGTDNTRDLGGYPLEKDAITKYEVFLRSALPQGLSEEDVKLLLDKNITTIIDLRTDDEVKRSPCFFDGKGGFDYYNFSLLGNKDMRLGAASIPAAYMEIAESSVMPNVFKVIAKMAGGCLYHCTAGKDRTGVVSAIILMLAGVHDIDIVADYVMTFPYLERVLKMIPKDDPDFPAYVLRSDPEYMQNFLKDFHEKYDTAEKYLQTIGLSKDEIETIKNKITC